MLRLKDWSEAWTASLMLKKTDTPTAIPIITVMVRQGSPAKCRMEKNRRSRAKRLI